LSGLLWWLPVSKKIAIVIPIVSPMVSDCCEKKPRASFFCKIIFVVFVFVSKHHKKKSRNVIPVYERDEKKSKACEEIHTFACTGIYIFGTFSPTGRPFWHSFFVTVAASTAATACTITTTSTFATVRSTTVRSTTVRTFNCRGAKGKSQKTIEEEKTCSR
jgi:hypothetical protein